MAHLTLTGKEPTKRVNKYLKYHCFGALGQIYCFCDTHPRLEARLRTCQTNRNGNRGRNFWSCANAEEYCDFFLWDDQLDMFGYPFAHLLDWGGEGICCDDDEAGVWGRYGSWHPSSGLKTPPPSPEKNKKSLTGGTPTKRGPESAGSAGGASRKASGSKGRKLGKRASKTAARASDEELGLWAEDEDDKAAALASAAKKKKVVQEGTGSTADASVELKLARMEREMAALRRQVQEKDEQKVKKEGSVKKEEGVKKESEEPGLEKSRVRPPKLFLD
ncbi:hypothetical protein JCM8202_003218 [Rhodotorula sphaerocarpa]